MEGGAARQAVNDFNVNCNKIQADRGTAASVYLPALLAVTAEMTDGVRWKSYVLPSSWWIQLANRVFFVTMWADIHRPTGKSR